MMNRSASINAIASITVPRKVDASASRGASVSHDKVAIAMPKAANSAHR
jgi:hypothetical protein